MDKLQFQLKSNKSILIRPTNIVLFSFLSVILVGSILLSLPFASKMSGSVPYVNALFTATSATCVTGLVVYDTATSWTLFGQLVILTLIQIGGLGLITLATFFTTVVGKKVGVKGRILAQESINYLSFANVVSLIRKIIIMTFSIELIGALLLGIRFTKQFGDKGIYMGIFHSISAFCNAGFDIMGHYSSLTLYTSDYYVVSIVAILIIVGGLGFMVWHDIFENKRNFTNLLLHTKIVLIMTVFLLISGTLLFFFFEYNNSNTIGDFSLGSKIFNSFFQSVTTRTAGFNTITQNGSNEISKIFTIVLMFIGAAPGSTAGGIKVTTIGVLLAVILSQMKGENQVLIFKRKISNSTIFRSFSIIGLGIVWIVFVASVITVFEDTSFIACLFEATSAFGTVGLSTGMTPELHIVSRILITITMFLGRVGPLTFAISIALRGNKSAVNTVYPEGKVMVG